MTTKRSTVSCMGFWKCREHGGTKDICIKQKHAFVMRYQPWPVSYDKCVMRQCHQGDLGRAMWELIISQFSCQSETIL